MKMKFLIALLLLSGMAGAQDYSREIGEVKSGQRTEARASWWGFNRENATQCLQAAIDSGVKKLIIDQTGSEWLIDPIALKDNQEIVVAAGVTVRARPGGYLPAWDCLLKATGRENIVLRGEPGAVLAMNKQDYQDSTRYRHSEWRHALSLLSCRNVTVRDLKITSSGGDGIYIGADAKSPIRYCSDITIENVTVLDNHRQGISIISAENLLIRKCVFNNTKGTAPQAGIDFEPNNPAERLVNCVVEDSTFNGNAAIGVENYLVNLNSESQPVSITYRNCEIKGNPKGVTVSRRKAGTGQPLTGRIEFIKCRIANSSVASVILNDAGPGFQIVFSDCEIDNRGNVNSEAIQIATIAPGQEPLGNIRFEQVRIMDSKPGRNPLKLMLSPAISYDSEIGGTMTFNGRAMDLEAFLKKQLSTVQQLQSLKPATVDLSALKAPSPGKTPPVKQSGRIKFRNSAEMLLLAKAGEEIAVTLTARQVGRNTQKVLIVLKDPAGKSLRQHELAADGQPFELKFTAEASGLYHLEANTRHQALSFNSTHAGQGMLMGKQFQLISPEGKLYFQVPGGVEKFSIIIWGDPNEYLTASLVNPAGKIVQTETRFDSVRAFTGTRRAGARSEIWSLDLKNAVEDVSIRLMEPLLPVVALDPSFLLVN